MLVSVARPFMFSLRIVRHGPTRALLTPGVVRRGVSTAADADVDKARNYCLNQLRYAATPPFRASCTITVAFLTCDPSAREITRPT
jgi:hypothetical protein